MISGFQSPQGFQLLLLFFRHQLAQLDKHRSAEREVVGSNLRWTNTQGLK